MILPVAINTYIGLRVIKLGERSLFRCITIHHQLLIAIIVYLFVGYYRYLDLSILCQKESIVAEYSFPTYNKLLLTEYKFDIKYD